MKKRKTGRFKRAAAVLLAMAMAAGLFPASVLRAEAAEPAAATAKTETYDQTLTLGSANSIVSDTGKVSTVLNAENASTAMGGNMLAVKPSGKDYRIKFQDALGAADGSTEVSFKYTGSFNTLAFLARYEDESKYVGVSIDKGVWNMHNAKALDQRENIPFTNTTKNLAADTVYTLRLEYQGDQISVYLKQEGEEDFTQIGETKTAAAAATREAGAFALRFNGTTDLTLYVDNVIQRDSEGNVVSSLNFEDGRIPRTELRLNRGSTPVTSGVDFALVEGAPMSGYAMTITPTTGDYRLQFGGLDSVADGAYQVAFKFTGRANSIGFLARYQGEDKYVGLSYDVDLNNNVTWTMHNATDLGSRENISFGANKRLAADTVYTLRLKYQGDQISVYLKQEGDDDFTQIGETQTADAAATRDAGTFALRFNLVGSQTLTVTLDNLIQEDAEGNVVQILDFDDRKTPEITVRKNKNNTVVEDKASWAYTEIQRGVHVDGIANPATQMTGSGLFVDEASPETASGVLTATVHGANSNQFGLVFRYQDPQNYAAIRYDGAKWVAGGMTDGEDVTIDLSGKNIPAPAVGTTATYVLDYQDPAHCTLQVGDVVCELGDLPGLFAGEGRIGFVTGAAMTLYASPLHLTFVPSTDIAFPDPEAGAYTTIRSETMQVKVGADFPHVYQYLDQDGNFLANGVHPDHVSTDMVINQIAAGTSAMDGASSAGTVCATTSQRTSLTDDAAVYEIHAKGTDIDADFTVKLQVTGNRLRMEITDVTTASGSNPIRTFFFKDHSMVSVMGYSAGAAIGQFGGWGPAKDTFIQLNQSTADQTQKLATYALLYDGLAHAIAIENNAENGDLKYLVTEHVSGVDDKYISVTNAGWVWDFYPDSEADTTGEEETPFAEVIIGGDENGDGDITWQDAGILYREIMRHAYGSEQVKNYWMYIAMNMSSQASQPFVRVLDTAKAISYLTDGFGQKVMNKGYQAGGHDDSHGDYDFVGVQQGGVEDFNTLIDEGMKYNILNGIHINATEFALDGYETKAENMMKDASGGFRPNWNWFDQAYLVEKTKDVASGELERRLDDLKEAAPNLNFIYVDVYQSHSYFNAKEFARYMNKNGWAIGTEALGDFNQDLTFVHWNTDRYYSTGGTQSQVLRFIINGEGDLGAPDRALMGALMPGVADWRNVSVFADAQNVFYRNNLPTKYMQHFELLSWTPHERAVFTDGVRSEVKEENGRYYNCLYKDDKLIARMDVSGIPTTDTAYTPNAPGMAEIFIPWSPETEDKIYCYNDNQTSSTWDLPNSWSSVAEAYLYRLTNSGRELVETIAPANGKVTLMLELGTPYVLCKSKENTAALYDANGQRTGASLPASEGTWGEGSLIKNFGFTSGTTEGWTTQNAEIDTTFRFNGNETKDPRIVIGANGEAGQVSQKITGLTSGSTYSFSVWVNAERPVTLSVECGGKTYSNPVETTVYAGGVKIKPSKYLGQMFQRLKVDVTVPSGVTEANLIFSAEAGNGAVYADDFRCWQWTGTVNPNAANYYYYEDFENCDENWGPFVSQVGTQPYIHLAYREDGGAQIKDYVIDNPDGSENGTSLKLQQMGAGIHMRTLPSTLKLYADTEYTLEFDYQAYREIRGLQTNPEGILTGQNDQLDSAAHYVAVCEANGTQIASLDLTPSQVDKPKDNQDFNNRASTEKATLTFTPETDGAYVVIGRKSENANDQTVILAIDNVRISKAAAEKTPVTITGVEAAEDLIYNGQPQAGYTGSPASEFGTEGYTVIYTGRNGATYSSTTAPKDAGDYTVTIAVPEDNESYTGSISLEFTIARKELTWNANLTASKPAGAEGEAKVYGTLAVNGLVEGDDVSFTQPAEMSTNGLSGITAEGVYQNTAVTPASGDWTDCLTGSGAGNYRLPEENPTVDARINGTTEEEVNTGNDSKKMKIIVENGISEVPEALAKIETLNTPQKIKQALTAQLLAVDSKVEGTAVYDVALMVSSDNGATWQKAAKDDFPADGKLTVTIPYPEGTDSSYTFTAVHMFTTDDFGGTPGEMETLTAEKTDKGLRVTVTGLSAVSIGWKKTAPANHDGKWPVGSIGSSVKPAHPFLDVSGWYADDVAYVYHAGIMDGVSDNRFDPNGTLTRAMVVTMLHRMEGRPNAVSSSFTDVPSGQWYAMAVNWAAESGVVTGYDSKTFGPDDPITREQLATILYRYAKYKGLDVSGAASLSAFTDAAQVSGYAKDGVCWAVNAGILNGSNGRLLPMGKATRAEAAAMFHRFLENS